ncbi:MAG: hypothetical protein U1F10_00570 [Burkholderiales bacterium]
MNEANDLCELPRLRDYTVKDATGAVRATIQAADAQEALSRVPVIAFCLRNGLALPVDVREHFGNPPEPYFSDLWWKVAFTEDGLDMLNVRRLRQYGVYNDDHKLQVVVEAFDMDTAVKRLPKVRELQPIAGPIRVREYVGAVSVTWLRDTFFRKRDS